MHFCCWNLQLWHSKDYVLNFCCVLGCKICPSISWRCLAFHVPTHSTTRCRNPSLRPLECCQPLEQTHRANMQCVVAISYFRRNEYALPGNVHLLNATRLVCLETPTGSEYSRYYLLNFSLICTAETQSHCPALWNSIMERTKSLQGRCDNSRIIHDLKHEK